MSKWYQNIRPNRTSTLLKNVNMLSINQMNALIELLEMWKSTNLVNYSIETEKRVMRLDGHNTRSFDMESINCKKKFITM